MKGDQVNSQLLEGLTRRQEMDRGAKAAARFWDANRNWLTVGWFAGFVTQLFWLYRAQHNPAVALLTFDTIRRAVETQQGAGTEN
jgi:hypothetical protein